MELQGKIFTGMGVGKEYISMKPYQDKIESITGFRPFPGTLNTGVKEEKVQEVLESSEASRIEGFEFKDEEYSGIDVYPVEVEGVEAAVLRMDVTDYGPEVVEIVAEENLRDKLGLEDGDSVRIVF
ncbi:DUF120 domain-containing protein [Candidatus Nanosalina sp. VS9-1]|uniref:DUF120 domain-containing protein n=1 Tax=Candidatus Nanosalina sp. VS9-1 TaxID=3388566 RepID=UPI0039DFA401